MKHLRTRKLAFTLTELLIAVAITGFIVVMLGQIINSAAAMWRTGDQRIDAFREARAALQLMAADLGRANIKGDPQMLTLAQYSSDGTYATEADAITPIKNAGKSDLCAVQYYLTWSGTTNTYTLVRRLKNSDAINCLATDPACTASLAISPLNFAAIYDKGSGIEEPVAAPVWDLEFRPGETDNVVTPTTDSAVKWKWIEIRFKAMSVNAARKLRSMGGITQATWADPTSIAYRRLILPEEQQFVTRISFEQNR